MVSKTETKESGGKITVGFLVYTTPAVKDRLDELYGRMGYPTRTELIRRIFNDFLKRHK